MITFIIWYIIGSWLAPITVTLLVLWGIYALVTNFGSVVTGIVESMPMLIRWFFELILWILGLLYDCIFGIFWFIMSIFGVNSGNIGDTILTLIEYTVLAAVVGFFLCMCLGFYTQKKEAEEKDKNNNTPTPPTPTTTPSNT